MAPNDAEMSSPAPERDSGRRQSGYQRLVIGSRDLVAADDDVRAESAVDGDVRWRWQFPVCSVDGQVMRYVRVNARTEQDAVAEANLRIDADRILGTAVRIRRATES